MTNATAAVSLLRRRMIDDMSLRHMAPAAQRSYIHAVHRFSRFHGRSPDQLGLEDVWASRFISCRRVFSRAPSIRRCDNTMSLVDAPMKPDRVAEIVLRGIKAKRLYIFTHQESLVDIEARLATLLADAREI